ncbi:LOB domain-containing protein 36-like [Vicia villosa]|uniref:LOB domain-containing protein 36-like n=1 Tax=Vicia villosa TaxID=3911 RepID=UPI00273B8837|nr:LOB domain-containing protein 36-like [Vicia villosa]
MSSSSSSNNNSPPCAACKIQRRKCTQDCIFKPYFPSNNPQKFLYVHKVFGASNVAKLLNEVNESQREDTVSSLAYEAEARLRDPVYGCVGLISSLQDKLKSVQNELYNAKKDLACYVGPQAFLPPPLSPPLPPTATNVNPFYTQQQQQRQDVFGYNGDNENLYSNFQAQSFHHPLMVSSEQLQQQQQPNNGFCSKKFLKMERQNLG